MQETMLSYDAIMNYFGEEVVADRYKYLYDKMQEYINTRGMQDKLAVCEDILHQVVMDYFTDVYRLKEFHKINNINMIKIVAYEVYWILKRKPIQIKGTEVNTKVVFANEGFATTFIAHEYLVPEETQPLSKEKEEAFLKYLQHLNYHLKYRPIDKQNLEVILYSFEMGKHIV